MLATIAGVIFVAVLVSLLALRDPRGHELLDARQAHRSTFWHLPPTHENGFVIDRSRGTFRSTMQTFP